MSILFFRTVCVVLLALVCTTVIQGQAESASLVGAVIDSSGAAVPGATVSIRNSQTNVTVSLTTAADGNFASPPLRPGPYSVTAESQGFSRVVQNVSLDVDQHARLDFQLQPGQITESVTVEANAVLLDTQSAALGNVRTEQAINDLPLNGRDFFVLTYLTPGASSSGTGYTQSRGASNQLGVQGVSVNGIRNGDNTTYFDGVHSQDNEYAVMILLPPQDFIQEFKMQTSGRDATTGRTGGALINVVSKTGGNEFHGTAFEFFRNNELDARNFFDPGQIPAFRQNQFGGSFGGRIKRDKTFFYADYQKTYTIQGQSFIATVPSDKMRSGDFSELSARIYNPFTTSGGARQPFNGNLIPSSLFNSTGLAIVNWFPHQNLPGLANNYSYNPPRILFPQAGDWRIDHHFRDSDTLFVRQSISRSGNIVNPGYFPEFAGGPIFPGDYTSDGDQAVIGYTHVFSSTFLADFRAGYSRLNNTGITFVQGTKVMEEIGIPGIVNYGYWAQSVGIMSITGLSTVGGSGGIPFIKVTNNYQYSGHFNWIRDKHSLKWGYDLFRRGMNTEQVSPSGSFSFNGQWTQNPASPSGTGIGLADALLGLDASRSLSILQIVGNRRWEHALFLQEDYRLTNAVTLNAGLRWELTTPWKEVHQRMANFVPALGDYFTVNTPQYPYDTMTAPNWRDFGPRVGLSWQALPKTVVHAAYGLFFDFTSQSVNSLGNYNAPFAGNLAITNIPSGLPTAPGNTPLSQGFLPYQPIGQFSSAGTSGVFYTRYSPDATVQQRSFSIQQQLTSDTVLTVAYVGTRGAHLNIYPNINQPVPGPGAAGPRRLYPNFSTITLVEHASDSFYNGLQVTAERRFSHGLAFLTAFSWSHSVDVISTTAASGVQNPLCLNCDRGPSDFDIRHSLVQSWSYELPFGQGKALGKNAPGVANWLISGWKWNGIWTWQSGSPFSVVTSTNTLGSGAGTQRANVVRDWHVPNPGPDLWFDPTAFTNPALYQYGNSGRNLVVGPGTNQVDTSLFKIFPLKLREGMRMEFRVEAFNIFNKPQFNNPGESGAVATAAAIGIPTSGKLDVAGNPAFFQRTSRQIQLAIKLYF
jgi:hypothetical protein